MSICSAILQCQHSVTRVQKKMEYVTLDDANLTSTISMLGKQTWEMTPAQVLGVRFLTSSRGTACEVGNIK